MGWKTAGKQQLGVNGGASRGLPEVASALTHAALWTTGKAVSRLGEASGDGPNAGEAISFSSLTSGETPPKQTGC